MRSQHLKREHRAERSLSQTQEAYDQAIAARKARLQAHFDTATSGMDAEMTAGRVRNAMHVRMYRILDGLWKAGSNDSLSPRVFFVEKPKELTRVIEAPAYPPLLLTRRPPSQAQRPEVGDAYSLTHLLNPGASEEDRPQRGSSVLHGLSGSNYVLSEAHVQFSREEHWDLSTNLEVIAYLAENTDTLERICEAAGVIAPVPIDWSYSLGIEQGIERAIG